MEHTMNRGEERSAPAANRPAVRNNGRGSIGHAKLVLLWLAVVLPLVWGAIDALRDVRYLFP